MLIPIICPSRTVRVDHVTWDALERCTDEIIVSCLVDGDTKKIDIGIDCSIY
jgi:hypothetical protein